MCDRTCTGCIVGQPVPGPALGCPCHSQGRGTVAGGTGRRESRGWLGGVREHLNSWTPLSLGHSCSWEQELQQFSLGGPGATRQIEQIHQDFPQLPACAWRLSQESTELTDTGLLHPHAGSHTPQQQGRIWHEGSTELWSSQEEIVFCMKTRTCFAVPTVIVVSLLSKELQLYWLPFQSWRLPTSRLRELPWKQAAQFLCWKEPQKTGYIILHCVKSL